MAYLSLALPGNLLSPPKYPVLASYAYSNEELISVGGKCLQSCLSISVDYKSLKRRDCALFIIISLARTRCLIKHLMSEWIFLNIHNDWKYVNVINHFYHPGLPSFQIIWSPEASCIVNGSCNFTSEIAVHSCHHWAVGPNRRIRFSRVSIQNLDSETRCRV